MLKVAFLLRTGESTTFFCLQLSVMSTFIRQDFWSINQYDKPKCSLNSQVLKNGNQPQPWFWTMADCWLVGQTSNFCWWILLRSVSKWMICVTNTSMSFASTNKHDVARAWITFTYTHTHRIFSENMTHVSIGSSWTTPSVFPHSTPLGAEVRRGRIPRTHCQGPKKNGLWFRRCKTVVDIPG